MENAIKNSLALGKQEIVISQPTNVYYCSIPLFLARINNLASLPKCLPSKARVPIPAYPSLVSVSVYVQGGGGGTEDGGGGSAVTSLHPGVSD